MNDDTDTFGSDDDPERPLPELLRARACPAGLPHTGDDPAADHGHTDCWLLHQAADRIEALGDQLIGIVKAVHERDVQRAVRGAHSDVHEWIAYGVRQGWVTEACLTHDGIPSTPEEDEQWEEGLDPCQHLLRLWPDGKPPAGSAGEREHQRANEGTGTAPFFTHAHPDHAATTWDSTDPDKAAMDMLLFGVSYAVEDEHGERRRVDPLLVDFTIEADDPKRAADKLVEQQYRRAVIEGGGTADPPPEAAKVVGHRESASEFVADGHTYRVTRIDPVRGDGYSDGPDGTEP